jgi:hypothetical protein
MDQGETPPARWLLSELVKNQQERDLQVGYLRGEVASMSDQLKRMEGRLDSMPTRDELHELLNGRQPQFDDKKVEARAAVYVILPWLLSGLGLLATAVAAWIAAG